MCQAQLALHTDKQDILDHGSQIRMVMNNLLICLRQFGYIESSPISGFFFPRKDLFFLHARAACFELPSNINTKFWTECLKEVFKTRCTLRKGRIKFILCKFEFLFNIISYHIPIFDVLSVKIQ